MTEHNEETQANEKTKKLKKGLIWKIVLAVVLIAGIGAGGYYFYTESQAPKLDKNAEKYTVSIERPKDMGKNEIAIPGYADIHMAADTDTINVALFNPNDNPCYFKFTIIKDEGKETLFESGLIKPGDAVTESKLTKKMKKGTYPITIKIDTFSLKDKKTEMNGSTLKSNLVAE